MDNNRPPDTAQGSVLQRRANMQANLTEEDKEAMKRCSREAFYYRSLPLQIAVTGFIFLKSRRGFLETASKYKLYSLYFFGNITANIFGRVIYFPECRKMFENLEHSYVREEMKRNTQQRPYPSNSKSPQNVFESQLDQKPSGMGHPKSSGEWQPSNSTPNDFQSSDRDRFGNPSDSFSKDFSQRESDKPQTSGSSNNRWVRPGKQWNFQDNSAVKRSQPPEDNFNNFDVDSRKRSSSFDEDKSRDWSSNRGPGGQPEKKPEAVYDPDKPFVPFFDDSERPR